MSRFGGMQLLPSYHEKLDPAFLKWYLENFTSTKMGYLHWPVTCTEVDSPEYTDVVGMAAGKARVWYNFPVDEAPSDATFERNSNSFALALDGFAGADTNDLGPNCASPEEIDAFLGVLVDILCNHRIPVSNVETHGEAADNVDQGDTRPGYLRPHQSPTDAGPDGAPYGPLTTWERWDLECWIDPATRKLWAPKQPCPAGWLRFADWIRGEAILQIQERTRGHWMPA